MSASSFWSRREWSPEETINFVRSLKGFRAGDEYRSVCFIEGVRDFLTACSANTAFVRLILSDRLLTSPVANGKVRELVAGGMPVTMMTPEQFRVLSHARRASGIAAIIRTSTRRLHHLKARSAPCWLAVGAIRNPGNLGTLIRSATAFGAGAVILLNRETDPWNEDVIRAGMGTHFRQTFVHATATSLKHWTRRHGVDLVGATPDAEGMLGATSLRHGTVFLLGEERKGLTPAMKRLCDRLVCVPMESGVDSLNVGVAGSLFLYEAVRQTRSEMDGQNSGS